MGKLTVQEAMRNLDEMHDQMDDEHFKYIWEAIAKVSQAELEKELESYNSIESTLNKTT
jgi:predicted phosphatase